VDYHTHTGINDEDYWLLTPNELTIEKLPRAFSMEIYVRLHDWFGHRPQIQPPHLCDLLNPHDEVFQREGFDNVDDNVEVVDLSVNDTNVEGLDCTPNINYVYPTDCDPLDDTPFSTVPPPSLSRQGPNPLGGIGVPNGIPLYGVTPPSRGNPFFYPTLAISLPKGKSLIPRLEENLREGYRHWWRLLKPPGRLLRLK
jgi:hypothetical protein